MGLSGEDLHQVLNERIEIELHLLKLEPAGPDLGEAEDVVDDVEHHLPGAAYLFHQLALVRADAGLEEKLGEADYPVHRCADLVTHVGHELALGQARRLGARQGHGQVRGPFLHPDLQIDVARLDQAAVFEEQ